MQKNYHIPPPQLHNKSTWNLPTLFHPLHLQRHNYTDLRENATHLKFFSTFIPIPNKSTYQELYLFPGLERSLEKEMAIHSSILAWEIPWMEEPGRLKSMWLQRVRHDWATSLHFLTAKRFPFCHFHSIRNKQGADINQDKRDGKSFLIIKR